MTRCGPGSGATTLPTADDGVIPYEGNRIERGCPAGRIDNYGVRGGSLSPRILGLLSPAFSYDRFHKSLAEERDLAVLCKSAKISKRPAMACEDISADAPRLRFFSSSGFMRQLFLRFSMSLRSCGRPAMRFIAIKPLRSTTSTGTSSTS